MTRRIFIAFAFIASIGIALLSKTYFAETCRIPTGVMEPTLLPGDVLFVWKWPYSGARAWGKGATVSLKAGDVVVLSPPGRPSLQVVRRVVGLPGDQVAIKGGEVILNGVNLSRGRVGYQQLGELSHELNLESPLMADLPTEKVPEQSIFVVGDRRSQQLDLERKPVPTAQVYPIDSVQGVALWVWVSVEPVQFGNEGDQQNAKSWFSRFRLNRIFHSIQ